jgi:hypothetical protein
MLICHLKCAASAPRLAATGGSVRAGARAQESAQEEEQGRQDPIIQDRVDAR